MRVLVTGATGFVGRAVVRRLVLDGHDPVAMVHRRPARLSDGVATVAGDILDPAAVRRAIAEVDAVCHLAAIVRPRESLIEPLRYFRVNVDGTLNVLEAGPARVVFTSTCMVYGEPEHQPIAETAVAQPTNPYGHAKLAAERAVEAYARTGAAAATILRTFNAAGAVDGIADEDGTRLIPRAVAVAAGRADVLRVNGDGSVVREYVHVDDLAAAVVTALEAAVPGACPVFNVGSGVGTSVADVIAAVAEVTGRELPVLYGPPVREPRSLVADSGLIRERLGWRPVRSRLRTIVADAWAAAGSG